MKLRKIIGPVLSAVLVLSGCSGGGLVDGSQGAPASVPNGTEIELGEPTGEITVSAYSQQYRSYLEEAARRFEEKYPDAKINVELFSAMPEVKTSTTADGGQMAMISLEKDERAELDYINKINTELMSGKGADIFAVDIIPYFNYINSGQFEDLNKYMESDSDFNMGDYRENIIKAAEFQGGQYILPIDFNFDYITYDSSLFTEKEQERLKNNFTFEQLTDAGMSAFERVNADSEALIRMFSLTPREMFNKLFKLNYSDYVDVEGKKADFDSGGFSTLLNESVKYAEDNLIKKTETGGKMTMESFASDQNEQFLYKTKNSLQLLTEYTKDLNEGGTRVSVRFGGGGTEGNSDNDVISGFLTSDDGDIPFSYSQAYAINSHSQNKTLAWEFIKFLMDTDMQTSFALMSHPINRVAFAEKTKQNIAGQIRGADFIGITGEAPKETEEKPPQRITQEAEGEASADEPRKMLNSPPASDGSVVLDEDQQAAYDAYIETFEKLADELTTLYLQDETINASVFSETEYFFSGEKTADDVANALQNNVNLYLSE